MSFTSHHQDHNGKFGTSAGHLRIVGEKRLLLRSSSCQILVRAMWTSQRKLFVFCRYFTTVRGEERSQEGNDRRLYKDVVSSWASSVCVNHMLAHFAKVNQ